MNSTFSKEIILEALEAIKNGDTKMASTPTRFTGTGEDCTIYSDWIPLGLQIGDSLLFDPSSNFSALWKHGTYSTMRALALGQSGQFIEAMKILLQVSICYHYPFLLWAKEWMIKCPGMLNAMVNHENELNPYFDSFLIKIKNGIDTSHPDYTNAEALTFLLGKADSTVPMLSSLTIRYGRFLRLVKQYDKAIELAENYKVQHPAFSYRMKAHIYKDQGKIEAAIQEFLKAAEEDKDDFSYFVEAGDLLLEKGDYKRAEDMYLRVPEDDDDAYWSIPSLLAAKFLTNSDPMAYQFLVRFAEGGNTRAQQLLQKMMDA